MATIDLAETAWDSALPWGRWIEIAADRLRTDGFSTNADALEDLLTAARYRASRMILPGPEGEPNVEVPQEGWLD